MVMNVVFLAFFPSIELNATCGSKMFAMKLSINLLTNFINFFMLKLKINCENLNNRQTGVDFIRDSFINFIIRRVVTFQMFLPVFQLIESITR